MYLDIKLFLIVESYVFKYKLKVQSANYMYLHIKFNFSKL